MHGCIRIRIWHIGRKAWCFLSWFDTVNGTKGHAFVLDELLLENAVSSPYATQRRLTCTRLRSPSPAATQIFFGGGTLVATGMATT